MPVSPLAFGLDLVLALGACLRLTRFIVADDVPGLWWLKGPLWRWQDRRINDDPGAMPGTARSAIQNRTHEYTPPGLAKYPEGLSCPYCMSVWMAAFVTLTLFLAGGPGHAADWWRYVAGFLTLAWVTGHVAKRMGDTE